MMQKSSIQEMSKPESILKIEPESELRFQGNFIKFIGDSFSYVFSRPRILQRVSILVMS